MQKGIRESVFDLEEGQAVFQWPESLSQESFEDLEGWLKLVLRRAKRSIGQEGDDEEPGEDS